VLTEPLLSIGFHTIKLHEPNKFYNLNEIYELNIQFNAVYTTSQSTNTAVNKYGKRILRSCDRDKSL